MCGIGLYPLSIYGDGKEKKTSIPPTCSVIDPLLLSALSVDLLGPHTSIMGHLLYFHCFLPDTGAIFMPASHVCAGLELV